MITITRVAGVRLAACIAAATVTLTACFPARAQEPADPRVKIADGAEYGYWAPEIGELFIRVPLSAEPTGDPEAFKPDGVTVDGNPVEYSFWYFDGVSCDYEAITNVSKKKINAYIPFPWKAGAKHEIVLKYSYEGKQGELKQVIPAPATGGVWTESLGGNQAFMVREEAGLQRINEPVEFDVTMAEASFPDPDTSARVTIMKKPGVFEEIPCQVYDTERSGHSIRFRVAICLSVEPKSETVVHVWRGRTPRPATAAPILQGTAFGGKVQNKHYTIQLDPKSGQMMSWEDNGLKTVFSYIDDRPLEQTPMQRTPDVYCSDQPWSHAMDWTNPASRVTSGQVFCETVRWGPMTWATSVSARVTYRFYSARQEVRMSSVMSVNQDIAVKGFRNGNMIFSPKLFTDIVWPKQDGSYVSIPIDDAHGNDMGAPPRSRFPRDTPWVALYNRNTHAGMALITAKSAYFSEGPERPNESHAQGYVSLYRNHFVYAIRAYSQTYCAQIRTYVVPMKAGTTAYEEMVFLPFIWDGEDARPFQAVEDMRKEILNPLVVVP